MQAIEWKAVEKQIKDLQEYPNNPRTISKKAFSQLVDAIQQDGYHQRIIIDPLDRIIGGHQRKKALLVAGWNEDDSIECLQASRELTPEEFDRINIRDNLQHGDWDLDILANHFEADLLVDWGFDEKLLGFDVDISPLDEGSRMREMRFRFSEDQAVNVLKAIERAADLPGFDDGLAYNKNSSAILLICSEFIK